MVSTPSLVRSPTTGSQLGAPNWKGVKSGAPGLLLLRRYQVMVLGSTTPMVTSPSPFQSPTTGIQPGAPKAKGPMSGAPLVLVLRRNQLPVLGSKTPTVDLK